MRRRADIRYTIVLEFDDGDSTVAKRIEVMRFHRVDRSQASGDVGLSLVEGKSFVADRYFRQCRDLDAAAPTLALTLSNLTEHRSEVAADA